MVAEVAVVCIGLWAEATVAAASGAASSPPRWIHSAAGSRVCLQPVPMSTWPATKPCTCSLNPPAMPDNGKQWLPWQQVDFHPAAATTMSHHTVCGLGAWIRVFLELLG